MRLKERLAQIPYYALFMGCFMACIWVPFWVANWIFGPLTMSAILSNENSYLIKNMVFRVFMAGFLAIIFSMVVQPRLVRWERNRAERAREKTRVEADHG